MQMRQLHPKPGQRVRLREAFPYQVPSGLCAGQEVTTEGPDESGGVYVRDNEGGRFRVPFQCVETEQVYMIDGRWCHESHPLVVAEFQRKIVELEATRGNWQSGIEWVNEANLVHARRAVAKAAAKESGCGDAATKRENPNGL